MDDIRFLCEAQWQNRILGSAIRVVGWVRIGDRLVPYQNEDEDKDEDEE